jgi:hypothetical protein
MTERRLRRLELLCEEDEVSEGRLFDALYEACKEIRSLRALLEPFAERARELTGPNAVGDWCPVVVDPAGSLTTSLRVEHLRAAEEALR